MGTRTNVGGEEWWTQILTEFDAGILHDPYRRLIEAALERYGANPVFVDLAQRYLATDAKDEVAQERGMCHVIVRALSNDEREAARLSIFNLLLDPREVWSTEYAVSFAVNTADVQSLRRTMAKTNLDWTVVPAGQPDYLIRELFVQGPDGSRFRVVDAPVHEVLGNVGAEVLQKAGFAVEPGGRLVFDRILPTGERIRIDADQALHMMEIEDGASLRIGIESRAGGPLPASGWIFLCHSRYDKPAVRDLYRRLVADGHQPWFDEHNLLPGQDWDLEIRRAIRSSAVVLVCLSKGSTIRAGYLQKELRRALEVAEEMPEGRVFLIPVRLEECDIPEGLQRWQWVDLYRKGEYDRLLLSLATALSP